MKSQGLRGEHAHADAEWSAEKDATLAYVACSPAYAQLLGADHPEQVLGTRDEDHGSLQSVAQHQRLERQVLARQSADLSPSKLHPDQFVLRSPLLDSATGQATGLHISQVSEHALGNLLCSWFTQGSGAFDPMHAAAVAVVCKERLVYASADFVERAAMPLATLQRLDSVWDAFGIELPLPLRAQWRHGRAANQVAESVQIDAIDGDACAQQWTLRALRISWQGEPAVLVHLDAEVRTDEDKVVALSDHQSQSVSDPYRQLVDNALNGVMILSGLKPAYANPAAMALMGLEENQPLESIHSIAEIAGVTPDLVRDIQALYLSDQATLAFDAVFEGMGRRREARTLHFALRRIAWRGQPAILASLTELRLPKTHERLLHNQRRFQDFAESAADYLWELDAQLRFTYISPRFSHVLGLNATDLHQRSIEVLFNSPHMQALEAEQEQHMLALKAHQTQVRCEFRWTRPIDGQSCVLQHSGKAVFERDRFLGYRGVGRDVTQDRQSAEQASYHASHDWLTGLLNRREFERLMREAAAEAQRNGQVEHVLCYIDLDNFKIVNDTCGHSAGDELLRQLTDLLLTLIRKTDLLARLGGDEFGLLFYDCDLTRAQALAEKVRHAVEGFQFLWDGNRFTVGTSIGLAAINTRTDDISRVMSSADAACYLSKEQGRNCINVYRAENEEVQSREGEAAWVVRIRQALDERQFKLCQQTYSPVREADNHGKYIELLLRLQTSDGEIISPQAFMPAAERYGLCSAIDGEVVKCCLDWLEANVQEQEDLALCSINLTGASLRDKRLLDELVQRIKHSSVPGSKLCFEISETATIANLSSARRFIAALADLGCQFSLDDFGSGMSSFQFLRDLPIDYLKIDGFFVREMLHDPVSLAMVRAINDICHVLGRKTVAESVETQEVYDYLLEMGVDFVQGYYISRPVMIDP